MKNYVNWAILAPGRIANAMATAMNGIKNGKLPNISGDKIRLYAVASRNLERAKEFADKWHFEKAYGSYEELYNDPEVDAVYIANPHAFHLDSVLGCLKSGKHVLCEKPAGCSRDQLNKMTSLAREKNLFFMEAMWTAFNPCIREIKKEISAGTIGNIINIDSRFCNRNPYDPNDRNYDPRQAGGALLDLGIYNIYFAMMLADFSPITAESSAVRMLKGVDAWNSVNLTFENGIVTSFQDAMDVPSTTGTHDAVIYGTKGFITVENFFMATKADVHVYKNIWGSENEVIREIREPFAVNGYEYECAHATEFILTGRTESDVHTFKKSEDLIDTMDALRRDWGMKYPWE
ncbi:Predicted dehydrogenase [Treponema bryantii]|uniref:Predicted dehydrogenase n=1 Tax=Treponema bryantii TaxID=163 RepID=A0A1I3M6Q1_9SPIR|nr:Gfo/Idh/MocA family oxidoreductase [Treponema bryantii]SFI92714.1 Predicted dehydrogenase [Treponema bryantii]